MNGRNATMSRCVAVSIAALLVVALPVAAQEGEVDLSTTTGRGQACTKWFYEQAFDKIEALGMTQAMRDAMPSIGGLSGFWETVDLQLGGEVEMLTETVTQQQGLDIYTRMAKFEKFAGDVVVQWVFDGEGALAGFAIRPAQ